MAGKPWSDELCAKLTELVDTSQCSGTSPILIVGTTPNTAAPASEVAAREFSEDVVIVKPTAGRWRVEELRQHAIPAIRRAGSLPITVVTSVDQLDGGAAVLLKTFEEASSFTWLCADSAASIDPAILGRIERVVTLPGVSAAEVDTYLLDHHPDAAVPPDLILKDPTLLDDVPIELLEQLATVSPHTFQQAFRVSQQLLEAKLDKAVLRRLFEAWCSFASVPAAHACWAAEALERNVSPRVVLLTTAGRNVS